MKGNIHLTSMFLLMQLSIQPLFLQEQTVDSRSACCLPRCRLLLKCCYLSSMSPVWNDALDYSKSGLGISICHHRTLCGSCQRISLACQGLSERQPHFMRTTFHSLVSLTNLLRVHTILFLRSLVKIFSSIGFGINPWEHH